MIATVLEFLGTTHESVESAEVVEREPSSGGIYRVGNGLLASGRKVPIYQSEIA